jgi:hypothetical protein
MQIVILIIFTLFLLLPTNSFANMIENETGNRLWSILVTAVITGVIGYFIGTIKSFREEKQKAYGEILPPILKMAYNPQDNIDEKEFSKALSKLWLYGSKKVTRRMENALKVMHDHNKGDITDALQEAVVEMRSDLQIWPWQKLEPGDVNHLYTRIAKGNGSKTHT